MSEPVAFLTFGAPLRKLYARNFPAYFGREVLESLEPKKNGQWLNSGLLLNGTADILSAIDKVRQSR